MPFCGNCGLQHKDGLNFCTSCGKPIESIDNNGYESLQSLSKFLIISLYVFISFSILDMLYVIFDWKEHVTYSNDDNYRAIDLIISLIFLAFFIVRFFWIYKASKLYNEIYDNMEYSPAMSVAWFLIPVANLFMPYLVIKDLCKNTKIPYLWWYVFYLFECLTYTIYVGTDLNAKVIALLFLDIANIFSSFFFVRIISGVSGKE